MINNLIPMARNPRSQLPGGWFHCINRGVNRSPIFIDDEDYRQFELLLIKLTQAQNIHLAAYCLMPNHWHIVLNCQQSKDMSEMFKQLLNWHTRSHHTKYRTIGHGPLYQGRYKSLVIQNEQAMEQICEYVEFNPVRAGLVGGIGEWQWSSFGGTVRGLTPSSLLLLHQSRITS